MLHKKRFEVKFVEKHNKLDAVDEKVRCCCYCDKIVGGDKKRLRYFDGEWFWHFDCYLKFVEEMKEIDKKLCLYSDLLEVDLMKVG